MAGRSSSGEPQNGSVRPARRVSPPTPPAPLVLLVEDDHDNRDMYRQYLEWKGFRVIEASDGLQAIERAAALLPAVIVTDLALPRLSGWEAVRRLKADSGTKHIPVLALSAHAFVDDADQARAAGCDVYLAKPCLPEDVARAIRSLMNGRLAGPSRSARRRAPSIPGRGSVSGAPDA